MDDKVLVARAQQGDAAAFTLLYRRHVNLVYGFIARRVVDRAAAEESTQEVFVRALGGLARFEYKAGASFKNWLFAITRHVISENYRAARRTEPMPSGAIEIEDPSPTPDAEFEQIEAAAELHAVRERCLNESERELFDLLAVGLTDREIAAIHGRRDGAVRTAHWRLLKSVRACLGVDARQKGGQRVAS